MQSARIHCTINGKMSQNTMEDYLAEGNAYRSDRKVIHKEATIKMLRVLSGDKNVDDTEEILKGLDIAEEDEISMCELFDQYTRRGISQGISKGIIIMCKDFNATYEYTLQRRMRSACVNCLTSIRDEEFQKRKQKNR